MLILTRKMGESVHIGESVKVTVLAVDGNQIKLGFDAPLAVSIVREELFGAVKEQNQKAVCVTDNATLTLLSQKMVKKT